jgi:hypothetical protein
MEAVEEMGASFAASFADTGAGRLLARSRNLDDLFDYFIAEVLPLYVEKNYDWRIVKRTLNSILIAGKPKAEVVAALGSEHVISGPLEILRQGFIRSVPNLLANSQVQIKRLESIAHGDQYDLYEIIED